MCLSDTRQNQSLKLGPAGPLQSGKPQNRGRYSGLPVWVGLPNISGSFYVFVFLARWIIK